MRQKEKLPWESFRIIADSYWDVESGANICQAILEHMILYQVVLDRVVSLQLEEIEHLLNKHIVQRFI